MDIAKVGMMKDSGSGQPDISGAGAVAFFVSDGAKLFLVSGDGLAKVRIDGTGVAGWQQIAPLPAGFVPVAGRGAGGRLLLWSAAGEAHLFSDENGFQPCNLPPGHPVLTGVLAKAGACLLLGAVAGPKRVVIVAADAPQIWRDLPDLPFSGDGAGEADALFATENRLWLAVRGSWAGAEGFALWSLDLTAEPQVWDLQLHCGAGRSAMNFRISSLCGLDDGSALLATLPALAPPLSGLDHPGSELIVLPPDGGWDLVIGEARFSPEGLKIPFSLIGEGFESPDSSWITALAVSGGTIAALCRDPLGVEPPVLRLCRDAAALEGWEILHSGDLPALVATAAVDPASAGLFAVGSGLAMTQGASVWLIADPAPLR